MSPDQPVRSPTDTDPESPPRGRAALRFVAALAWLVPSARRGEWRDQWQAELAHYRAWLQRLPRSALDVERLIWMRACGAVPHACLLRLEHWSTTMWLHDLRLALRSLLHRPLFTAVAVLMLALGIGANATVLSWIEAVLLRPLPGVSDQRALYALHGTTRTRTDLATSYPNFRDLRGMLPPDVGQAIAYRMAPVSARLDQQSERAYATLVSGNYFQVLGVGAAAGRVLTDADDRTPDAHPVAVISHGYWTRRFGAAPDVVGRAITLNGRVFTIVGVSAAAFRGSFVGLSVDLFVPMMMQRVLIPGDRLEVRTHHWLKVLLRLAPGASRASADAALAVAAKRLAAEHDENAERGLVLFPLWRAPSEASGFMGPLLLVLIAVVALVLLIVCANVANLLLARATSREHEVAIRLAIGASRWHLVRQMLVESLCLSAFGAAAGVVVAHVASRALMSFVPPTGSPIDLSLGISPLIVVCGAGLAVMTGMLSGLAPALQASRPALLPALRDGAGGSSVSTRRRLRQALVVVQVAVSVVLLITAGLFVRTLREARQADLGYTATDGVLTSLDLAPLGWTMEEGAEFYRQLLSRVGSLPGVTAAGLASDVPLSLGSTSDTGGAIDGYEPADGEEVTLYYNRVSHGYFEAFGVPLVRGRGFTADDGGPGTTSVVVVNETMARRYWKGRDAIGGRVRIGRDVLEVVGIAKDGKHKSLTEAPRAYMYLPLLHYYDATPILHVRATTPPATLIALLSEQVHALAPDVPLFETQTYADQRDVALLLQRIAGSLLAVFASVAVLLAAVGLYGVLAFLVGQRRREIGVRLALGARPRQVVGLVLRSGLGLVAGGAALGLAASIAVAPLIRSQLVGVSTSDPTAYAGTLLVLILSAGLACAVPAWRAARLDPVRVLREL